MNSASPDISIIIPANNEQRHLPELLQLIELQRNIIVQTIVVDGGSQDQTLQICQTHSMQHDCICLSAAASRPAQMNLGAQHAKASLLLFLHADSYFEDNLLLHRALLHYQAQLTQAQHDRIAGHFSLKFNQTEGLYAKGFYFYAAKTSLNRPDTINGDQGLLISKSFFNSIGHFDERLHFMEDARISTKIFARGSWITLPGVIQTSARRFISEGLTERQILNSFLCTFNYIGLNTFFEHAASAYRSQAHTSRLQLRPFLRLIHRLMLERGLRQACRYWYQTGSYVADNAWQLVFNIDCQRHRVAGEPATDVKPLRLQFFDRYCTWFFNLSIVNAITAVLTLIWFYGLWIKYR